MAVPAIAPRPLPYAKPIAPAAPPVARLQPAKQKPLVPSQPVFDEGYWKLIDTYARRGPGAANDVVYLRDHQQAWQERLDLVNNAKSTIVCSCYCVEPDAYGIAYIDALLKAQQRGVQVAIGIDTLAETFVELEGNKGLRHQLDAKIAELRAAGGIVRRFGGVKQQLRSPGSGTHAKMLVVDSEKALVGGRNVGADYYGQLFNDFEMRFSGQIAMQFEDDVYRMLGTAHPYSKEDDAKWQAFVKARVVKPIAVSKSPPSLYHVVTWDPTNDAPHEKPKHNRITDALIATVQRAHREITLTSNYVVGNADLRKALMKAARDGVRVRIITTGEEASHISKMAYWSTVPGYEELKNAGVKIYETQKTPDHAKIYVVDDMAAFGSYNFSDYSDSKLAETLVFTNNARDVKELHAVLEKSIADSQLYDPAKVHLTFGRRLMSWLGKLIYWFRTL